MPSIGSQPPVRVHPRLGPTHHSRALLPPCRPGGKWENGLCAEATMAELWGWFLAVGGARFHHRLRNRLGHRPSN